MNRKLSKIEAAYIKHGECGTLIRLVRGQLFSKRIFECPVCKVKFNPNNSEGQIDYIPIVYIKWAREEPPVGIDKPITL